MQVLLKFLSLICSLLYMQIENEYGSYGNDKVYLNFLRSLFVKYFGEGSVIFHSTDGNADSYLLQSYVPGVYQVSPPLSSLLHYMFTLIQNNYLDSRFWDRGRSEECFRKPARLQQTRSLHEFRILCMPILFILHYYLSFSLALTLLTSCITRLAG